MLKFNLQSRLMKVFNADRAWDVYTPTKRKDLALKLTEHIKKHMTLHL